MINAYAYKYQKLIEDFLDWDIVETRLAKYPNIKEVFPIDRLRRFSTSPPYFSHFMAWRLGTYQHERAFEHFEVLLSHASELDGWRPDKCYNYPHDFEHYFSLVWELQVANLLSEHHDLHVTWTPKGPDLQVFSEEGLFFVECYTYHKSFGLELFIRELLAHIHPDLKVKHTVANKLPLPKGNKTAPFLERLLFPFLNENFLSALLEERERNWPVLLDYVDEKNLAVYLDGHNMEKFNANTKVPYTTGSTDRYLEVAMEEAVNNKRRSNRIIEHRPNLLAVNFLLSLDYVVAADRKAFLQQRLPQIRPGPEFDGLLFTVSGIDNLPERDTLVVQSPENSLLWSMGNFGK